MTEAQREAHKRLSSILPSRVERDRWNRQPGYTNSRDGRTRPVMIEGKHYPTVRAAADAHGCSTTKIYKMLGESHRSRK